MTDEQIKELWKRFGDISLNENEEIEQSFHIWEMGTDRLVIWHWFDENYSKGLKNLIYGEI